MNIIATLLLVALTACNIISTKEDPITYGEGYLEIRLATDKACYAPGEEVSFTLNKIPAEGCTIRYRHLAETLSEEPLTATTWSWMPPSTDYQGYLVDIYNASGTIVSIAVDVSSEPMRFPRNGFLSAYGDLSDKEMNDVLNSLNRYHINYVQFQDWHWKHHHPLAGTSIQPMEVWTDIISRNCYRKTINYYIQEAHNRNMKCLFYNLAYGALDDAQEDGVDRNWYVFKDRRCTNPDMHELGSPFKSSIYLVNPANTDWQDFLAQQNDEVYKVFDFDGYQIDQLGDRGTVYDYTGNYVNMSEGYLPFIDRMKEAHSDKRLVMNAVGQYGQEYIAQAPTDFLYTEVWDTIGYAPLSNIITQNDNLGAGKKTVLAAYMNYANGQRARGYFNTHSVLLTTAAIHLWGGAMLQMGEHMLTTEYFPNNNLSMRADLHKAIICYYDFITAYENLLRDGGTWIGVDVQAPDGETNFNQWQPQLGQVATVGKQFADKTVVHLLNFNGATHTNWVDNNGRQGEPKTFAQIRVSMPASAQPTRVYTASPDYNAGAAQICENVDFSNGQITFTLPYLKYWTMIVVEY